MLAVLGHRLELQVSVLVRAAVGAGLLLVVCSAACRPGRSALLRPALSVVTGRVLIMFMGWWHVRPDEERVQWALEPFAAVGPLRFGMGADEVTQALLGVTGDSEHRTWVGGRGNNTWRVSEGRCREFGLHLYYRDGRLSGIAVDALRGPQVTADGTALVGRVPSALEQWMCERAETRPDELAYMSAGVPSSKSLGVVINVQREGDHLLTRPVFYPAEALDDLPHWLPQRAWQIHD
ncbi:hypothetical protein ACWD4P_20925 [Kitasatospora sp. NPDC002543]